jgi:hypothetical protein
MPSAGIEHAILAIKRPQTVLDRAATGIGILTSEICKNKSSYLNTDQVVYHDAGIKIGNLITITG